MKKTKILFIALLSVLLAAATALSFACGGETGEAPKKLDYDMSSAAWNYTQAFTYDGQEKSVTVTGLPAGVTVRAYDGNTATDAGEYTAKVTFDYDTEKYNAPVLDSCEWKIEKAEITGLSLESRTVDYDGKKHSLTVSGNLPDGVTVSYKYNGVETDGVTEIGNYAVQVIVSGKNYDTWEQSAELKIRKKASVANIAETVLDAFGTVPDFMEFLPDAYGKENRVLNAPVSFDGPVNVAVLPKNGMGKQLNTVYKTLQYTDTALEYVSLLYGGFSAITEIYQDYINRNPDNYKEFEGEWNGFAIKILLTDGEYVILAKGLGATIEIYQSTTSESLSARIDVADKAGLKITYDGERLRTALNAVGVFTADIEFVRDEKSGTVTGVIYETTGVGSAARLTTCTVMTVTKDHLIVVGNKGDFIVPGQGMNVEVYDNATGYLCGTEVYERMSFAGVGADYDTLWYNLYDITGINSIRAELGVSHEENDKNKDTVYVNGKNTPFVPVYNKIPIVGTKTSRQYDIEFKTMYFYLYDSENDSYALTEQLIPMLFVQRENLDSYLSDIKKENSLSSLPQNLSSAKDNAVIAAAYKTYSEVYEGIKDAMSYENTIAFIGKRNDWFASLEDNA